MIIQGNKVAAAACFLPLSLNPMLSTQLGTRHRAAIGVTEESDAVAVVFRMQARLLRFMPEDGLKVICQGRINFYEQRGEYQLIAEMLEPKGVGDLHRSSAYRELRLILERWRP